MQFGKILMILLALSPLFTNAQEKDITGLWKGTIYNDTTQRYYNYEIGISKEKGKYSGFSHTWFTIGDTQYFGVKKISVKIAADGKIITEDNGLIAHNYPVPPNKGVRQLNILTLDAADSIMQLTGPFNTNRTKDFHILTGNVSLRRKNDFWQSSLVPHLQELGKDDELSFVKEEKQLLANADQAEKTLQLTQRSTAIKEQNAAEEKDVQSVVEKKRKETEKQKQEVAREQEAKKVTAEKDKADKTLAKQEQAKQTAAEKETARLLALNEKQEKAKAAEKEKQEKMIARQEAKNMDTEKKLQQRDDIAPASTKKEQADKKNIPTSQFKTNTEPAAEVALRKTIVQQTVTFSSDSLQLSLYDNGEIDGDTVSVLMNGKLILAKQGLGIKAIKHTIYIPHDVDSIEMVMYAETLGTIPPNTGLLVIRDGKELYEIRFSGDLQKNASIVFNRKKQ